MFWTMIALLLPYLLGFFVVCILTALAGWVVLRSLFPKSRPGGGYLSLFLFSLTGLLLITTVYAIARSRFMTVEAGLLLLMAVFYLQHRKPGITAPLMQGPEETKQNRISPVQYIYLMLTGLLLFAWSSLFTVNAHGFPFTVTGGYDYSFYSLVSKGLAQTGVENSFLVSEKFLDSSYAYLTPYHYFDLWFNALISGMLGFNFYLDYAMVVHPFFLLLAVTGLLAVWESFVKVNGLHFLLSLLLLCFGEFYFSFYGQFHYLSPEAYRLEHFGFPALVSPDKDMIMIPFGIAVFLLVRHRHLRSALSLLLVFPFLNFTTLPTITGGIVLMAVLGYLFRALSRKEMLGQLALLAGVVLFFYLLYFAPWGNTLALEHRMQSGFIFLKTRHDLSTMLHIWILSAFQMAVMYVPFLLLLLWWIFNNKKEPGFTGQARALIMPACLIVSGLFAWSVSYRNQDSVQFLGNFFPAILGFLMGFLVWIFRDVTSVKLNAPGNRWRSMIFFVFSMLLIFNGIRLFESAFGRRQYYRNLYSDRYLEQIMDLDRRAAKVNPVGVMIRGPEDLEPGTPVYVGRNPVYFSFTRSFFSTVPLDAFDFTVLSGDPMEAERERIYLDKSFFSTFVRKQRQEGKFASIQHSQLDFVKQYRISFLVAARHAALSESLRTYFDQCIADGKTGERFFYRLE